MTGHGRKELRALFNLDPSFLQSCNPAMLTDSETELTTAATDALLGVMCIVLAMQLAAMPVTATWKRTVWVGALGLMACASSVGAVVHGLALSDSVRTTLWKPLYLALGLAVALVVVGGVCDWRGEDAARRVLPWALAAGVLFVLVSQWLGGAFIWFIAYEAVATLLALAMYASLAASGSLPGASLVAAGIAVSLVAAVIQATTLSLRIVVPFDHNGLFHLVQMVGIVVMAMGIREGMLIR